MRRTGLEKTTVFLLFIFLAIAGLYFAREFLVPLSFSALFAMLLIPLSKKFERKGISRGFASIFCILIIFITLAGLITLFTTQLVDFAEDLPELRKQLEAKLESIQGFIQEKTNVSPENQVVFAKSRLQNMMESADEWVRAVLLATTGTLAAVGLMAIYIFFFMFYRDKFENFILEITRDENHEMANNITDQIGKVTQQYLSGVMLVILILAVLNSVGLMIIGIENAIFFGCVAAFLNIIPYVGVLIGSLFPIIMALLTYDTIFPALGVAGVFAFNQFLENNFLTPNIVGAQVKINPLAAIIAIIIGGLIWGVAGMILFIPFLGIAKIIFDNVEDLKPYGKLIGEENGSDDGFLLRIKNWFQTKFRKKKSTV